MFFSSRWILGQNARNLSYIKGDNFSLAKKLADSKLGTKKFLAEHKVAVPETLWIIKKHSENTSEKIESLVPPFVIKPNNGYGWKWILVIDSRDTIWSFITNSGDVYTPAQIKEHFSYILDGFFSLSWWRDRVIIEKKIILTKEIDLLGTFWLPDLRIIAYNMVPVMAMMRIPTAESDGKANIHGGACAAWIDIGTGKLTYISHKWKIVKSIPGIGDVRGIVIPEWDNILSLAVQVQKATGIKFLGCDVVLDETAWPLLLEINIRPWLEIQNVNLAPLKTRLDKLEWVDVGSVEKWVRLWRDLFSGDVEERIKKLSWKEIVGSREYLQLDYEDKIHKYLAQIRISKNESVLSESFARDVLKIDVEKKSKVRINGEILWVKRNIRFDIRSDEEENIVLWKNTLRWFLIDPFKYKKWENPSLPEAFEIDVTNTAIKTTQRQQLLDIDKKLFDIDKKLLILKYITPLNIEEQKQIFIEKKGEYIPEFKYQDIPFDIEEMLHQARQIEISDIPFAEIFQKKQDEVIDKLRFFKAFKEQDTSDMFLYSKKIFGDVTDENFSLAKERIEWRDKIKDEDEFLEYLDIVSYLKKFNHIYSTKIKVKESDQTARFTMKWDVLQLRVWAKVGKREIRSIIAHEIEWHYLRKINGKNSIFTLLSRWWARYIETDEGIAIYNQNRFLSERDKKYYSIFERYYFVRYAQKHSYKKLISHLLEFYNQDYELVFWYMLRLKRWFSDPSKSGVFMKDVVYVNGFYSVENYMETGWSLKDLYIWKLHVDDIITIWKNALFVDPKKDIIIPFSA